MRATLFALILALLLAVPALAQGPTSAPDAAMAADPADVASIDAVVAALYASISGPAGERDWDRLRSLFAPGAVLSVTAPLPDGSAPIRVFDVEGYIERAGPYFRENAFYEHESGRRVERFGNVAHAMSGYVSLSEPGGEPFARGINSITLLHDGTRWYVLSVAWDVDREGNPLPDWAR